MLSWRSSFKLWAAPCPRSLLPWRGRLHAQQPPEQQDHHQQQQPRPHSQRRGRCRVAKGERPVSDSFGGVTPEQRAAESLTTLFTYVALRIVLAQLGGGGEGGDLPPTPDYLFLRDFLEANPLTRDGNEWLLRLLEQNRMLGLRVLEVRDAYVMEDFDWDRCRELALSGTQDANTALLRQFAAERFSGALAQGAAEGGVEEGRAAAAAAEGEMEREDSD